MSIVSVQFVVSFLHFHRARERRPAEDCYVHCVCVFVLLSEHAVAVLHRVGGAQEDDTLGGVGAEDAHLTLDGADVHRLQVDAADHLRAYEVVGSVEGGDLRRRFLLPDFGAEVDGDRIGGMAGFLVFGDGHHGAHPHFHFVKVCYFYHAVSVQSIVSFVHFHSVQVRGGVAGPAAERRRPCNAMLYNFSYSQK